MLQFMSQLGILLSVWKTFCICLTDLMTASKFESMRRVSGLSESRLSPGEDKAMIDRCVEQTVPGGFAEVNQFARESLSVACRQAGRQLFFPFSGVAPDDWHATCQVLFQRVVAVDEGAPSRMQLCTVGQTYEPKPRNKYVNKVALFMFCKMSPLA